MKPFEQEFGWSRADISMAFTLLTVGCAIGGIVWGSLSDRIGARKVGYLGAFAISFGLIALRWQSDLWVLYLLYFLIGAVGFAPLFAPMVAIAGLWFDRRKGFAIGIVTAGGAIGQGVVPYITRLLITEVGWRDAALYVGVGYLLILLPLLFLLKPPPAAGHSPEGANRTDSNQWGVPHKISIAWLSVAGFLLLRLHGCPAGAFDTAGYRSRMQSADCCRSSVVADDCRRFWPPVLWLAG